MSSLLRSPVIRRALSAASARAPAVAGERAAIARRGPRLLTVPRRHLSGQEQIGKPPTLFADQVNVMDQKLKKLHATMEKGFVLCATIRFLIEEGKLRNPFVQWAWMDGLTCFLSSAEQAMKSRKAG